jgi:hypothetical protein
VLFDSGRSIDLRESLYVSNASDLVRDAASGRHPLYNHEGALGELGIDLVQGNLLKPALYRA